MMNPDRTKKRSTPDQPNPKSPPAKGRCQNRSEMPVKWNATTRSAAIPRAAWMPSSCGRAGGTWISSRATVTFLMLRLPDDRDAAHARDVERPRRDPLVDVQPPGVVDRRRRQASGHRVEV